MQSTLRQASVAVRFLIIMTIVLGIAYPLAVFGFSRVVAHSADGAYVSDAQGQVVGAENIGQLFEGPKWFHSRPSAAGDGYDALSSSGSNLAADNPDLVDSVLENQKAIAKSDRSLQIPADAVTASGSGLDPHISPEYAAIQIDRVARANGLSADQLQALVAEHTEGRWLGFLGEPRVNVLELNLALSQE